MMCFNATLDGRWVIETKYQYHDLTLVAKQKFRWSHFRNYLKPELSWVAVLGMAVGDAIVKSNSVSHPAPNFVDPEILLRNYFETRNLPAFFILNQVSNLDILKKTQGGKNSKLKEKTQNSRKKLNNTR